MSRAIATIEPTSIQAGDSIEWNKTLSQFSANDWTLTYYFIPRTAELSATPIAPVIATNASGDYEIRVTAATTADWLPGTYTLVGKVSDADERFEVYRGALEIVADLALAQAFDNRTVFQRWLDKIDKMIEEGVIREVFKYKWGGMDIEVITIADALTARNRIAAMVIEEANKTKQRKILTRFKQYR